jgi:eukaryotic-like serine/threonine-protein kinase
LAEHPEFARLDALLDQALDRAPAERAQWIAAACGADDALKERLLRLVALAEGGDEALPAGGGLRGEVWNEFVKEVDQEEETAIRSGERLGRYEIRGLLGVGAMGRVYRGFDPALGREVAIKSLRHAWDQDTATEERRRFEREARLLATLNHPNIASIFGWEIIDGSPCLVLELIEGQTLADRLRRGPLRVAEAIEVALEVAAALEEAHAKGVVHRDLKPGNVARDASGRVKVLDFGIAKVVAPDEAPPADPAHVTTGTGAVLGTAPYMSPEQVRGEPVDTRTDVWAFGTLLYEMLSGRRAFDGRGPAEIMAAVLRDDVDWSRLPADTPAPVRRLLRRCLRRDLRERLQDIGDARIELQELDDVESALAPASSRDRSFVPWALAAVLAAVLAFVWTRPAVAPGPPPVVRLALELPAGLSLADDYPAPFDVSPDGTRLVVLALRDGVQRLYLRKVDGTAAEVVAGTEGAWQPVFSPDGTAIAFFADRKLKRAPLDGGPVLAIAEASGNARGASFAPDGSVVFAPSQTSGLMRVDPNGGTPTTVTKLDMPGGDHSHRWPQVLPGGRWVIFTAGSDAASFDEAHLDAVSLDTGERRRLLPEASHGRYAGGRLFFARAGRMFAVAFDPYTLVLRGSPEMVLEGLHYDPRNGGAHFAISESGTLIYVPAAPTSPESYLAWIDGAAQITRIGDTARVFREPRLSPDGRRVAARIGTEASSDLWMVDTTTATLTRLSFGLSPRRPVWMPDGRTVTVAAHADGRWRLLNLPLGGAATPVVVYESPNRLYPNAWTPDARALVFQERRPDTGWDVRLLEAGPDGRATGAVRDLAATPFNETYASVSPDGRYFAYDCDELDQIFGIYIAPLDEPAARVRGADTNSRWPRWGRDGQLYCWFPPGARPGRSRVPEGLHRIPRRPNAPGWAPAGSDPLWRPPIDAFAIVRRLSVAAYAPFDVDLTRSEPRFLVLETGARGAPPPIDRPVVVLNWPRELDAHGLAQPH